MIERDLNDMRFSSGPPWNLECTVEPVESDLVCRIHGEDRRISAVALSRWRSNRARTECLTASGREERGVAMQTAHVLCGAGRRRVICFAGIHLDSLHPAEIPAMIQAAYALGRQAARRVEQRHFEASLQAPACSLSRIQSTSAALSDEIDGFLAQPINEVVTAAHASALATELDPFGKRVNVFAPLYLSDACSNDCAYCGFRRSARFQRTRLSIDQAVQEARHLANLGHRTIDLVTGEIATDRFVDYVCETTRAIREATDIRRINLNLGALSTRQFRRLKVAGADGYHLHQETYAPGSYFAVHLSGLKRDMAYRLGAPRRAADAGFDSIGLGVLLGLHPIREDLAALAAHARILMDEFPRLRLGFSLPRVKSVDGDCKYTAACAVDDDSFIKSMLFLKLHFPRAHLTLTTRERPAIRDRLVSLGVTRVSAGVSTAPGGYTLDRPGSVQFAISDRRPLSEIVELLQRSGLTATSD